MGAPEEWSLLQGCELGFLFLAPALLPMHTSPSSSKSQVQGAPCLHPVFIQGQLEPHLGHSPLAAYQCPAHSWSACSWELILSKRHGHGSQQGCLSSRAA